VLFVVFSVFGVLTMGDLDPGKVKSKTVYSHPGTFYGLCIAADANRIFAGSDDYAVHVYDRSSDKKEAVARWTKHDNYVSALAFLPRKEKPRVVSGSYDRTLIWWDSDGQPVRTVEAHQGWVRDLVLLSDGTRLASVGDDMLVKVWEADTGKLVRALEGHAKETPQGHVTALYAVAVSSDGKFLASGDRHGQVFVWEADTGKQAQKFEVPVLYTYDPRQRKRSIGGIRSLAFSRDGNFLAAGGIGQVNNVDGLSGPATIEVWDWRKPERRFATRAQDHKGLVNALLFHPDGAWLIGAGGGGDNGFVAFWKADQKGTGSGQRIKTDGHVHRAALNAAGTELYAVGHHKLEVWNLTG
jgi:WD40 repeat protein